MSSFLPCGATNPRPAKIDNTAGANTPNSAVPVLGNSSCLLAAAFATATFTTYSAATTSVGVGVGVGAGVPGVGVFNF